MKTTPLKPSFTRLTAAQKRVAIAQDVLAQIKLHKFSIRSGRYWEIFDGDGAYAPGDQKTLCAPLVTCRVCAADAAIISGVRLFNRQKLHSGNCASGEATLAANKWFSKAQLALIEAAFEKAGCTLLADEIIREQERITARRFTAHTRSFVKRAELIYRNIIKNHGTFKP